MTHKTTTRTLKALSSRPTATLVWLGCGVAVGYSAWTSPSSALILYGPWLVFVAWVAYLGLWLPRLIIHPDGLSLVNGIRTHWLPFGRIDDVEVRHSVTVTAEGRKYKSWGAPLPPSALRAGQKVSRSQQIQVLTPTNERLAAPTAVDPSRDAIVRAWRAAAQRPASVAGDVSSRWNTTTIVVGSVAMVLIAVSVIVR